MVRGKADWDYIIIGAGSAGCAAAHQLVSAGRTVLVLEAGGSDRSLAVKIPAGVLEAKTKHDWGYRSQPDPSRNGASENWARGRVLGGCSSVNGMVYVRGAAEDFDRWAEQCAHRGGWSAREVTPIFRELETSDQNGPLRGKSGPMYVRTVRHPHRVTKMFIQSACAAGYRFNEDYNGASQEGVAYVQLSQRGGLRWSSADAFLKPNLGRKNLQLLLNAMVEQIEIANGRAVAVSFVHEGQRRREAARDIILCAGTLNSPKLLMLSGVGDPTELGHHGIKVVRDLPGVGRNLKEHPLIRLLYRSKVPTNNLTGGLIQKLGIAAKFAVFREGPISNLWEGAAFLRLTPLERAPDIQIFFTAIGSIKLGDVRKRAPFPAVTIGLIASHPTSRGWLRLTSSDPNDPPLIESRLLEAPGDVEALARGVEIVRKIMRAEPIASVVDSEIVPGASIERTEVLRKFILGHTEVSYHPIGTCRMGVGLDAVVDPDCRVRGMQNLWVADASIIPDHMSANMNAVCMMIGAKLGKQLVARNNSRSTSCEAEASKTQ